jgi:hypothetical protein
MVSGRSPVDSGAARSGRYVKLTSARIEIEGEQARHSPWHVADQAIVSLTN